MWCGITVMLSFQAGQPRLHTYTTALAKMFHVSRNPPPVLDVLEFDAMSTDVL